MVASLLTQRTTTMNRLINKLCCATHPKPSVIISVGIASPWLVALSEIDRSLTLEVSKSEAPNILAALSLDKFDQMYSQYIQINTDASKDS